MQLRELKLPKEFDRRRKLTDEQKNEIIRLHKQKKMSYRELMNKFNVSHMMIYRTLHPEKNKEHENNKKLKYAKNPKKYDRKLKSKRDKEYRKYKKKTLEEIGLYKPVEKSSDEKIETLKSDSNYLDKIRNEQNTIIWNNKKIIAKASKNCKLCIFNSYKDCHRYAKIMNEKGLPHCVNNYVYNEVKVNDKNSK